MNGTLQALGWTLIHFCWEATIIAAIYLATDLLLKNARSQTRYSLTLATLSSMFLAFMGTLRYVASHNPIGSPPVHPVVTLPVGTFTTQAGLLANGSLALHLGPLLPWLDGMWMMGVVGLSIRFLGGWLWLRRLRRTTMAEPPEALQASFQKICMKLGIARVPELRVSEIIPGPITIGILRTLVLLPASALLALSPEQLEAIFAHELAHVRRADYFWNLVQTLAETLFFFHPAVWWIGKRLREQRELCCDDIAIATCPDRLVYATALFRLENQRAAGLNLAMALDGHQSSISFRSRILRILGESDPQSSAARARPLSLFAVCVSLFFLLSPLPKALGGIAEQGPPVKPVRAMLTELARVPKHPAPQTTHGPLKSHTLTAVEDVRKTRRSPAPSPADAPNAAKPNLGRPSVSDLMNIKAERIVLSKLTAAGVGPRSVGEFVSDGLSDIIPESIKGTKAAGYDATPAPKLQALRSAGVTPEDVKAMNQQSLKTTAQDSIAFRIQLTGTDVASSPQPPNLPPPPAFLDPATSQPPPHILRRSRPGQPRMSAPSGQPRLSERSGRPRLSGSSPPTIQ